MRPSAHLFDLARAAAATAAARPPRRPAGHSVRPAVQRILDSMAATPAYLRNGRMDILAANQLGRALYAPVFDSTAQPANRARFIFLDPAAAGFFAEWDRAAGDTVALLRAEAGRNPHDQALSNLIGELSTRSEAFRQLWAAHDVRFNRTCLKRFHHPIVGDFAPAFEALHLTADGLRITAYTAEPGTPSADALSLLASWAAITDQPQPSRAAEEA
jgi:MmyB-like transcription regulator ligand binding domain